MRSGEHGCTCACASPAVTSPAAAARRTGTPPPTRAAQVTRSLAPPNPGKTGAGATSTTSHSCSRTMTLPELHLADWRPTKTPCAFAQILGKIPRHHVTAQPLVERPPVRRSAASRRDACIIAARPSRSRSTSSITPWSCDRRRSFEVVRARRRVAVADFDARLHAMLGDLGIDVDIKEEPFGLPMTTSFTRDVEHASWNRDAIERFGRVLDWSDTVFEEFSGWFNGKTSPVHLFWHSLDLAVTRFGPTWRTARCRYRYPGDLFARGDLVRLLARRRHPRRRRVLLLHRPGAPGLRDQPLPIGSWIESGAARSRFSPTKPSAPRPTNDAARVLPERAYEAGARLAGWDTTSFESRWCPPPVQLQQPNRPAADFGRPIAPS